MIGGGKNILSDSAGLLWRSLADPRGLEQQSAHRHGGTAAQGTRPRADRLWCQGRIVVLAGLLLLLLVRIAYLIAFPLDLVPDEAYYWDWSRQLDWSYYSKPPLIAWLIGASTVVGGHSEIAIRWPAAALGTIGLWGVYELGRRLYGHATGVWAMMIVAVSPGTTVLCLLMTVDAPFLTAWTLTIYCLWRMLENETADARWLAPSILATGAALLTKQTAIVVFPLTTLFLVLSRPDRAMLKSPVLWLWFAGSASCLLPAMIWNYHHGWITVAHTRDHLNLQTLPLMRHVTLFLEFALSQFGVLSPFICTWVVIVMATLLMRLKGLERRERFLVCFGGLPMLPVIVLSLFQRVQPNWPVALHLTCVIAMAAWCQGALSISPSWDAWRRWVPVAIGLGVAMSVIAAVVPFVVPSSSLAGTHLDPTGRLRGWRELGREVARRMDSVPNSERLLVIAATSRGPVSELAFYLPGRPRVYRWNPGDVVDSQHDVWGGPIASRGSDALIISETDSLPSRLQNAFARLVELDPVTISLGPNKVRSFHLWLGRGLSSWPDPKASQNRLAGFASSSRSPGISQSCP